MDDKLQTREQMLNGIAAAADEGWIEWSSGECPVDGEALVDVRFVGGEECSRKRACAWDWTYDNRDFDIVAYRVASA